MTNHRVHDYRFLIQRWRAVAREAGAPLRPLCLSDGQPLFFLRTKILTEVVGGVYISAGIHGDEPAGPEALITWAEENVERLRTLPLLMLPCLNPWGLINNRRHDTGGNDLNRSFHRDDLPVISALKTLLVHHQFLIALHLHEDYDAQGLYLYEVGRARPFWGDGLLASARRHISIDGRRWIDGRKAHGGLIRPRVDWKKYQEIGFPEALWMRMHHTDRAITAESPSEFALEQRIRGLKAIIEECVKRTLRGDAADA